MCNTNIERVNNDKCFQESTVKNVFRTMGQTVKLFVVVWAAVRLFVYRGVRLFVYRGIRLFVFRGIRLFVCRCLRLFFYRGLGRCYVVCRGWGRCYVVCLS